METKYDLNAPAFGPNAQKVEVATEVETKAEPEPKVEVEKEEVILEPKKAEPTDVDAEEEPKRVTYSRFKNVWAAKEEAERLAQEAKAEAEQWRLKAQQVEPSTPSTDLPSWWLRLYGDTDESKEAFKVQAKANDELRAQITHEAEEKALAAVKNERQAEENRTNENLEIIDSGIEKLAAFVGRELTEKEESKILDIVDEFTPKDEEGNYLGAILPFEKAWEVYELRNNVSKAPKQRARDAVAALNGADSSGVANAQAEKDKNFNPLNWNAWKDRL